MNLRRRKKEDPVHPAADKALAEANQHYDEVKARDEEVREISAAAKKIQRRNHFSERIEAIMEGKDYRGE